MWAARADAPGVAPHEAERLRADTAAAWEEAEELVEKIALLEYADAARSAWFAHTAVTRDNAERARFELRARGVDIDRPADLTTAPEWLATHRAEQAEHERDAEITEDDMLDDDREAPHARRDRRAGRGRPAGHPGGRRPQCHGEDRPRQPTSAAHTRRNRRRRPAGAQDTLAEIARQRTADA